LKAANVGAYARAYRLAGDRTADPQKKIKSYRLSLALDPQNANIWAALGNALKDAGNRASAEAAYNVALRWWRVRTAYLHLQRAELLEAEHRREDAAMALLYAMWLEPDVPAVRKRLSELCPPEAMTALLAASHPYGRQQAEGVAAQDLLQIFGVPNDMTDEMYSVLVGDQSVEGTERIRHYLSLVLPEKREAVSPPREIGWAERPSSRGDEQMDTGSAPNPMQELGDAESDGPQQYAYIRELFPRWMFNAILVGKITIAVACIGLFLYPLAAMLMGLVGSIILQAGSLRAEQGYERLTSDSTYRPR
jgi:tetratricopeptide (TPR) repeat protein